MRSAHWEQRRTLVIEDGLLAHTKGYSANERMRILVEYSSFHRPLGWAGWLKPRQVLLSSLQEIIKGQQIRIPVVTAKLDGSEIWWGVGNDSVGDVVLKTSPNCRRDQF